MNDLQLEINFSERKNRFRDALGQGEFVLLIENSSPGRDNDPAAAGERLAALENAVLGIQNVNTALAITDRSFNADSWRGAEYAVSALSEENRDRHVIYLSGRDSTHDEVADLIRIAVNGGVCNLVPASGNALPGDSPRECRRRPFTESVETLRMLRKEEGIFAGATVNPFQYTPYSLMGQYFKLAKKLNVGASFIVTQAGWDMLKLQSLRWYLSGRSLFYPMIARLVLLTPDKVERILAGEYPGVNISPDFQKILHKELHYSVNQFEAAQYRRLELQAAGCRLLGFSGIQLAGAELPGRAKIAAERIANALREFTSFEQWLEEYNSYLARTEMAPFSSSFYLYDRTLRRPYPQEETPAANELGEPRISGPEKFGYELRRFLFPRADRQPASAGRLLKKITAGCKSCKVCRLPKSFYLCPANCPKQMANGPCGGVKPNGLCELSANECVFSKMVRLAHWRGELSQMEDELLDSGK